MQYFDSAGWLFSCLVNHLEFPAILRRDTHRHLQHGLLYKTAVFLSPLLAFPAIPSMRPCLKNP
jgi:hypothetical protein